MNAVHQLLTEHIDIWTAADTEKKSGRGRSSGSAASVYGVKKLRELILELAVRGKLVPQDPNDESAEVILKSINKEKNRLLSEKKIRDAKLAVETDMPEVDIKIPNGWRLVQISDLLINPSDDIVDGPFGSKLKATEYTEFGTPIIRIQNIDRGIFKENGIQYISNRKAEELCRHSFIAGDVVLNKLGEPAGKTCVIPPSLEAGVIVADIIRIRLDELVQDKRYFVNCMNSPFVSTQFAKLAKGVTRQRVNLSQVRALKVPIPPFNEQRRIVAKVDELMALCDQLETQHCNAAEAHEKLVSHLLGTLTQSQSAEDFSANWQRVAAHFDALFTTEASIDALKQTLLQLAVMGKLVPQDPNEEPACELLKRIQDEKAKLISEGKSKDKPLASIKEEEKSFDLPPAWEWVRLGDISSNVQYGYTDSANHQLRDVLFLRITDIQDDAVNWDSVPGCDISLSNADGYALENNDIVIARTGGTIGKSYLVTGLNQKAVFASYLIRIGNLSSTCAQYKKVFLGSRLYWEQLIASSMGTGQPNVNGTALKNLTFSLPPLEEQHRIVAKVDELMALCDALKIRINDAQRIRIHLADTIVNQASA